MEIKINDVSKVIKGNTVLDHITMEMKSGNIYGLWGINGSGKTMLMRAICGLIKPSSGTIEIDGVVLGKEFSFPENIGVMLENPSFLSGYTGYENLKLLTAIKDVIGPKEIRMALTAVGLDPDDKRKYKKFSLGMKQRLGIACAIMEDPELIILDEPFNALDDAGVSLVKKIIINLKKKGKLIILSCHDKEELETLSDKIFRLRDGKFYEE